MEKLVHGLLALSVGLTLASSSPQAHACCGLDERARACSEAAIRAELSELSPPLRLAFSFSDAVCHISADAVECTCEGSCRCASSTPRLHEDEVLAELDESERIAAKTAVGQTAGESGAFVKLSFAFSQDEADRMLGDRIERELADNEPTLTAEVAETRDWCKGTTLAFTFARDSRAGRIGDLFRLEKSFVLCRWPLLVGPGYKGAAFERLVSDLKMREREIAAEFTAAATHTLAGLDHAEAVDGASTNKEETLAQQRSTDDCVLCETSIDAPLPALRATEQYDERTWEAPRSWPVDRVTPRIPDPVRMFDAPEHTVMGEVVAIEGVAMRFADENQFTFGGVRFSR